MLCYNKENSTQIPSGGAHERCFFHPSSRGHSGLYRISAVYESQYGPSGLAEFRTDLPRDDCFDRLDQHSPDDVFAYECRRENDGGFTLHLTLHQPTQQPLDTLYTLRFDPGRQTIVTLIFIREAFGYKEPLFQPAMLDEFMLRKFDARRTK